MAKKRKRIYDSTKLIAEIEKIPLPLVDEKHNLKIFIEGRARSNQTRIEHIVECGHDLKERDIKLIQSGIKQYYKYKKDPYKKGTYNYYLYRKGKDKGFIKISIQIDKNDKTKAYVKTIFVTYNIK